MRSHADNKGDRGSLLGREFPSRGFLKGVDEDTETLNRKLVEVSFRHGH